MFLFIINSIIIHISIIHVISISSSVAVGLFWLNLHEIKTPFPREIWQAKYKGGKDKI